MVEAFVGISVPAPSPVAKRFWQRPGQGGIALSRMAFATQSPAGYLPFGGLLPRPPPEGLPGFLLGAFTGTGFLLVSMVSSIKAGFEPEAGREPNYLSIGIAKLVPGPRAGMPVAPGEGGRSCREQESFS